MGRHKVWRAQAKKMRRKRSRQKLAQERDTQLLIEQELKEKSPRYQAWLAEQNELEAFACEEEARLQMERNLQWERDEELAQQQWCERQEKLARAREERAKQELRIREEWKAQLQRQREAEEEKKREEEEKQRKQEELMARIENFIKKGGEIPAEANISTETHPGKAPCPFFSKTGACRFGDRCSRNHSRPGMSKVLLIPSFYSHFGMDQSMAEEYDTDVMLEFEDSETYQHFREFYEDVVPEFESHGRVVQFKVCCNCEPHLRGNVYIEYSSVREAVGAFQKFQGRWYGGRQLNVEFTCVVSWKAAICGLFFKGRCPKGRGCNFLHVFRNPKRSSFADISQRFPRWRRQKRSRSRSQSRSRSRSRSRERSWSISPSRRKHYGTRDQKNWRWSESPEPRLKTVNGDIDTREGHRSLKHSNQEKEKRQKKRHSRSRSRRRNSRSPYNRRSRSPYNRRSRSKSPHNRRSRSRSPHSSSHRKRRRHKSPGSD